LKYDLGIELGMEVAIGFPIANLAAFRQLKLV